MNFGSSEETKLSLEKRGRIEKTDCMYLEKEKKEHNTFKL